MAEPRDFDITKRPIPEGTFADILFNVLGLLGSIMTVPPAAVSGNVELVRQWSLEKAQPTLNTPAEAAVALHRGIIDEETYHKILARHGVNEDAAKLILQISKPLLNIGEVLSLWLRDELNDTELSEELHKLGFTPERIAQLQTLAFPVPQVQDLVQFAVREVFDVTQAEKFGQFEGVSAASRQAFAEKFGVFGSGPTGTTAAFEEFAKQNGLSPEWTVAFWAAHWILPSPNQMFEMFQRRIIDEETLDVGIRALDFPPFWRDALKQIAFRPLTRVDVRRMHALGLLDEDELTLHYQDLGFSPENAALQTEFTLAFNAPKEEKSEEFRDLTRSQILSFLRKGLFNEEQAREQLSAIAFADDDIETIISLELIKIGEEAVDNEIRVIRARLKNGVIDFNGAVAALDAIDLPAQQRDLILAQIEVEQVEKIRLPSRADLDRLMREELIEVAEYLENVQALGFEPPWPERFAQLIISDIDQPEVARNLSRALVGKLLSQGLIDEGDARRRLGLLGFSEQDITLLIRSVLFIEPEV